MELVKLAQVVTDNPLKYVTDEENYDYWNMTSAMALHMR